MHRQRAMKSISMMTSAEIRQHRSLLGKVYRVTVRTPQGHISDIDEFSPERAWNSVGETYRRLPEIIKHGWVMLGQEVAA